MKSPKFRLLALAAVSALALAGCSASGASTADTASTEAAGSVTIGDNTGSHEIQTPVGTVVALDNRTFETLSSWGIEVAAAPLDIMPTTVPYSSDENIANIGNHREPNLELIVAAQPDLIISGQRFTEHDEEIAKLVPDATIIDLEPREGEDFGAELERQTLALGEIFGKQTEAEQLVADFQAARDRVTAAYDPAQTVMSVIVSGGEIGYSAPGSGRTFGPLYSIFDFTPALEVSDSSSDHQGDDISVEAIAASNPDWILVLDRDAGLTVQEDGYQPAEEVIANSDALANVTAVQDGHIYYVPSDTYTNESIQTYTEIYNGMADAFEAAK
ncbi:siderophore ABC transporter substrate-binding protein [Gulosibacter molinativorax]|uniref:Iron ABC transporter substrate-binding protein n=1 Tax=Gulosibacter molinativorax TaxID=256821 RepID=A0ABT7C7A3_9MICO|nr:ABC transporter substrate-binding protein [Gulosibacter molinativorax]MDJ1371091.1 iron ABC transporter substrate-binding protein [Gulosibacter molinativorax]QUY61451.1 Putative ABC transporter solute-binding protein YclQ [Gulosibacter molinativorax]